MDILIHKTEHGIVGIDEDAVLDYLNAIFRKMRGLRLDVKAEGNGIVVSGRISAQRGVDVDKMINTLEREIPLAIERIDIRVNALHIEVVKKKNVFKR